MNITTSLNSPLVRPTGARAAEGAKPSAVPSESFTLSGGSESNFRWSDALKMGAVGAVPALGAVSNFTVGAITGLAGQREASGAAVAGLYANVIGTGALIAGAIIGNTPTTLVGGGLLLASGFAGGYAAGKTD